jgi:hypothetical protein
VPVKTAPWLFAVGETSNELGSALLCKCVQSLHGIDKRNHAGDRVHNSRGVGLLAHDLHVFAGTF